METSADFQKQLAEALEKKRAFLEEKQLRDLKENFQILQTGFKSVYNLLLRKSLVQEDQYKYDKKVSEIKIPPSDPFGESEKREKLSLRLSDFDIQLDFVNSYYNFTIDGLTMDEIKKLAALTKYFRWEQVTETSSNLMTRTLAQALGKIKQGSDTLSANIVSDALNQTSRASRKVLSILKDISEYHREMYKLRFRENVLPHVKLTPEIVQSKMDTALKLVKQKYPSLMGNEPFYQALIIEVLNEEYGEESETLREELLNKLKVEEEKPKTKTQQVPFFEILFEGVRVLAGGSVHLQTALGKLKENSDLIQNRKLSFGEKFKRWLKQISKKKVDAIFYEIEYFDGTTATSKTENLNFNKFLSEAKKRVSILANLSSKMSSQYRRLEQMEEEKVYEFLVSNLQEIQIILRRLPALDTYFKTEVPKEQRGLVRGIKLEINGIKNAFVKANQKKHEYVSKKEEREQLKKLGINVE